MKITSIAWRGFALPFRSPYTTSRGSAGVRHGLMVFVGSDSGLSGIGEASPIGPGTRQEVERVAGMLNSLAPKLLTTELPSALETAGSPTLLPHLRFGLETALLDLEGKQRGCSIAELLGGRTAPIPVNATIASAAPEKAAAEAEAAARAGFSSFKLKVGAGSLEQDDELVAAVRRKVGNGARIRVDPNEAWTVGVAIKAIRTLSKHRLEYVEQPVAANDIAGMAQVRRSAGVPIAADDALCSIEDLRHIIAAEAADLFILKAARLGGLRAALQVAGEASASGFATVVTSSLESSVGIAASIHLAAAFPAHPSAHGLATGLLFSDDLVSPGLAISNGTVSVPGSPGLGVTVDRAKLDKYGTDVMGLAGSPSQF